MKTPAVLFPLPAVLCFLSSNVASSPYTASVSTLSKDDWKARLAPHLSTSLQTVAEKINQTPAVQSWLKTASMQAAEDLGRQSGMQGEMQGYMRMMDAIDDELPNLVAAVDELTEGCGHLDLDWRPHQPNFSRLSIDFDRDYSVSVFERLDDCTLDATREAIATVGAALPEGEPFPNRPNTVTGLVAHDGHAVGIRVKEHLSENRQTYRSVTLLPPNGSPIENLSPSEAAQQLARLLCSPDG